MIQETSIFRTSDGSEFRSRAKAEAYESRAERVAAIMARLPTRPGDSTNFSSGHGYIQHERTTATAVLGELLTLIEAVTGPHKWIDQTREMGPVEAHPSWVGRLISDFDDRALNRAWGRMTCIHWPTMREYGQQYFANNPSKAEGDRLN